MATFYRVPLLLLISMQLCSHCMASVEQLVQVFETAIDVLAPPEKAAKLKNDMESARPCLDTLVTKIGDDTLEQVLKGMIPLAMRCGTELMKTGKGSDEKKKIFLDCVKRESGDFLDGLPDEEKEAFLEAKSCIKAIFSDME